MEIVYILIILGFTFPDFPDFFKFIPLDLLMLSFEFHSEFYSQNLGLRTVV